MARAACEAAKLCAPGEAAAPPPGTGWGGPSGGGPGGEKVQVASVKADAERSEGVAFGGLVPS